MNLNKQYYKRQLAFSLIEMLMALLAASLLMAALAPVMTRRMHDSMTISVEGEIPGKKTKTHEITYEDCLSNGGIEKEEKDLITGKVISRYCEGEFTIPYGYNGNMKVTAIGAGGGGGVSSTAGYIEYTTEGSTNTFTVPNLINKLEATLISGGAGGGAGGQALVNVDYLMAGDYTWTIPNVAWNKNVIITACGGGGGAGGSTGYGQYYQSSYASGNGGRGGYTRAIIALNSLNTNTMGSEKTQKIIIGGGGGGGAAGAATAYANGLNGRNGGGGGGGADAWCAGQGYGGLGGKKSNNGGGHICNNGTAGFGGKKGDADLNTNEDGQDGTGTDTLGGSGGGAGNGGASRSGDNTTGPNGGGGGGGSTTGYGGGGGGGGNGTGGGGGGGGATIFGTRNNQIVMAPGGGGGGASGVDDFNYNSGKRVCAYDNTTKRYEVLKNIADSYVLACARWLTSGGGGGGGGGTGGGNGGIGGRGWFGDPAPGGNGINNPASTTSIFGENNCNGGSGDIKGMLRAPKMGGSGQDGAMRISYLDYGPGGSGGGSGQLVPIQPVSVQPNEVLTLSIGRGATGGAKGGINSNGSITNPTIGGGSVTNENYAIVTKLMRGSNQLLSTIAGSSSANDRGARGGGPTGEIYNEYHPWYGVRGEITNGITRVEGMNITGFSTGDGYNAGNAEGIGNPISGQVTYPNDSTGGSGGTLTTPWFTCTPGKGGTSSNPTGGNAQGYGCGGGGGYGLSNGGKGAGGYARISWNKYWDTALNSGKGDYKYANVGTAGGGASGNIVVYTISNLKSGDKIKIRIGKGGEGASVNNNTITNAIKGGDTVFGQNKASIKIIAGGGNPGTNPSITGNHPDTTISNGTGGDINNDNNAYSFNNKNLTTQCNNTTTINNCYIKGLKGYDGASTKGGNGANLPSNSKILGKSNTGNTGGTGGTTGSNAKGANAYDKGIGSGGGGAGILDIGTPTISTHNPNTGGNGSNGKILLEWWE